MGGAEFGCRCCMERHELRELVEDALEALKPRYQRTRTPFSLQMIREEAEDQHAGRR